MKEQHSSRDRILKAAFGEFASGGLAGARMQSIADRAGVNKALLHYYFNSKEELFRQVYHEAVSDLFKGIFDILEQKMPLLEKIDQFTKVTVRRLREYPGMASFVVLELNRSPEVTRKIFKDALDADMAPLQAELETAADRYEVVRVTVPRLLLTILSLTLFPYTARIFSEELIRVGGGTGFEETMIRHEEEVCDIVLNWLTS